MTQCNNVIYDNIKYIYIYIIYYIILLYITYIRYCMCIIIYINIYILYIRFQRGLSNVLSDTRVITVKSKSSKD